MNIKSTITIDIYSIHQTKLIMLDSDTSLLILAIIIKKSRGPNTLPCGTPLSTGQFRLEVLQDEIEL